MVVLRQARCQPRRLNEVWTLDFVHDQLSHGRKFRELSVVDVFSREALAVEGDHRLRDQNVVGVRDRQSWLEVQAQDYQRFPGA